MEPEKIFIWTDLQIGIEIKIKKELAGQKGRKEVRA